MYGEIKINPENLGSSKSEQQEILIKPSSETSTSTATKQPIENNDVPDDNGFYFILNDMVLQKMVMVRYSYRLTSYVQYRNNLQTAKLCWEIAKGIWQFANESKDTLSKCILCKIIMEIK